MSPLIPLEGRLIVSVQPVIGGPLDRPDIVARFALAAIDGGAAGLRIQGREDIAAVRAATALPIIGLVKHRYGAVASWITGTSETIDTVADAGADIVAIDATDRPRPTPFAALVRHAHGRGLTVLADVATVEEGAAAVAAGADAVASTLSGYTDASRGRPSPDVALVRALAALPVPVIAEGNIRQPADAAAMRAAGAFAIVVGSAITRPEHVTGWFRDAIAAATADPD
jgi:putative N-acetylmannosamine-6-phosphate epimerase